MRAGLCKLMLITAMVPVAHAAELVADPVGLRGDIGGLWFNPALAGRGLQIDVLDRGQATVAWYTFDGDGRPTWLVGLGSVDGDAIEMDVSRALSGSFEFAQRAEVELAAAGHLRIEFAGCNTATMLFAAEAGSGLAGGEVELSRLTSPDGTRCDAQETFAETRSYSFEWAPSHARAVFADLPDDADETYELDVFWEPLPAPLNARHGLRLTGHNRSDDLAMLIKQPVAGLLPDTVYDLEVELELASNVPGGCPGIGGSPGDSVYLKLGAVTVEPTTVVRDEGSTPWRRLNFDYGVQSADGADAKVVGVLANSQSCDDLESGQWELKTVRTEGPILRVRSDADGMLWVVAGTDSAFEGLTHVYFTRLQVRLRPLHES